MKLQTFSLGIFQTNCYVLSNKVAQSPAFVIDPDRDIDPIVRYLKEHELTVPYILLTHGHFDHLGGVNQLREQTGAKVVVHESDADLLANPQLAIESFLKGYSCPPVKADVLAKEGDTFSIDGITLKLLHTPGHSKGSSVYIGGGMIFSGDTLFQGGIGRTDLFEADYAKMKESLRRLAAIRDDYAVYPGHGGSTTLAVEKKQNPYLGLGDYDDYF